MTVQIEQEDPTLAAELGWGEQPGHKRSRFRNHLDLASPKNIGAVYVLIAIIIVFSFWAPQTFPEWATLRQVVNGNTVDALASLGLVIPLAAGVFDISFAYNMSLSGVLAAYLIAHTGLPLAAVVCLAVGASTVVGLVNAFVVVNMLIDSLIGTLATGSLIQAFITMITSDNAINAPKLAGGYANIAQKAIGGITLPVIYSLVLAAVIWSVLSHTATGRRIYATGFNADAARLAGVNTRRIRYMALVFAGMMAGIAGVVLGSQIGAGSPTAGTPYLLPVFAAVFLGATQSKRGRFNAWGAILAVVLLGTGTTGLGLANAPAWSGSMFTGLVLIVALAVTGSRQRFSRVAFISRLRRLRTAK